MTLLIKQGRNMVSSPFEPYPVGGGAPGASTLDKIVGNQLTGHAFNKNLSDNIEVWLNASAQYKRAWFDNSLCPAHGLTGMLSLLRHSAWMQTKVTGSTSPARMPRRTYCSAAAYRRQAVRYR